MANYENDVAAIQKIPAVSSILDVVCRTTGMGFAAVARVTEDRWIACQVLDTVNFGLPAGGELPVETTLCHEVRQHRQTIVIDNVADDPVYAHHHTPRIYSLKSYISVPIMLGDGRFFGTLCAIDSRPANLKNPQIIGMLELFASLIAFHLDADEQLRTAQVRIEEQAAESNLREKFIAVLAHDMRNPLAALDAGTQRLMRAGTNEQAPFILGLMRRSIERMQAMINNVVDLSRGRLAGGLQLDIDAGRSLGSTLELVVDELRAAHPDCAIETDIALDAPASVDHVRIAQLLSNLIGNAVQHGAASTPIRVVGKSADGWVEISVSNSGNPIPPDVLAQLFQPFYRDADNANRDGLGLGLYISSEIAKAHGGELSVTSDAALTTFTFRMPVR